MAEENKTQEEAAGNNKQNKSTMLIVGAVVVVIIIAVVVILQNRSAQQPTTQITPSPEEITQEEDSSIAVSDQTASDTVTIDSATLTVAGYIVIHEQADGELGPVIGNSQLYAAGTYQDVEVELDRSAVSGETLYAMLHDDDGNSIYEFPGADTPTQNQAGEVVVLPFEIL